SPTPGDRDWSNAITVRRQRIKAHRLATATAASTESSNLHIKAQGEDSAKGVVETCFQSPLHRQTLWLPIKQVANTYADVDAATEAQQAVHGVAIVRVHPIATLDQSRTYARLGRWRVGKGDRSQQAKFNIMNIACHHAR